MIFLGLNDALLPQVGLRFSFDIPSIKFPELVADRSLFSGITAAQIKKVIPTGRVYEPRWKEFS